MIDTKTGRLSIGIYGGTFDPLHEGHLAIMDDSINIVDLLMIVPNKKSPFKINKKNKLTDEHRLNMIGEYIKYKHNMYLDDTEIKKDGISYTIDTVKRFAKDKRKIFLILGMDAFNDFEKFKDYKKIASKVNFILYTRPGYVINKALHEKYKNKIIIRELNYNISSTELRKQHD